MIPALRTRRNKKTLSRQGSFMLCWLPFPPPFERTRYFEKSVPSRQNSRDFDLELNLAEIDDRRDSEVH